MKLIRSSWKVVLRAMFLLIISPSLALASGTSSLPFEPVLATIADSLSGPVALSISLIGLAIGAMILILGDPGKGARMIISVLVGFSIISGGLGFMGLFGTLGATM